MNQLPPPPPFMPPPHMSLINPELAPKETLYVSNLNDKIKNEDMRYGLYFLFSQFGEILKIIIKHSNKLRGQAFIVFQTITGATNAKAALYDFKFYEKPLKIEFARSRSQIFDQMEGNIFVKERAAEQLHKKELKAQKREMKLAQKLANNKINQQNDSEMNNILIAQGLPSIATKEALFQLFCQYPGLRDLNFIDAKNLAFIEYENENQAKVALVGLNGFLLTQQDHLKLCYAKKN